MEEIEKLGYSHVRCINGVYYGIYRMLFSTGLFCNITEDQYESRYCYPNHIDAVNALKMWDGCGDPPGDWIKQRGINIDRSNPNIDD